jgi:cleavage and polyadenylation specificity factor subunit 1
MYKTYQHFPTKELDANGKPLDISDRLAVRFRRIPLDVVARETPEEDEKEDSTGNVIDFDIDARDAVEREVARQERRRQRRPKNLIPFTDVAGFEGVFVLGSAPLWILSSGRGLPRAHPMICEGRIECFTQFHNVNCKQGFITSNVEVSLRVKK